MARPKLQEPKKQFTLMLKPATVQEIDRLAKKLEISRSQLMGNLIQMGLDDAKVLEKTGALWVVKAGTKALRFFKEQMKGKGGLQPKED
jgi:metal-responsive CopG/Arc/MetJ family transcriptional regulator